MKELPVQIQLDPEDTRHLYEQIYEFIREEIRSGNNEFMKAEKTIKEALFALKMRSVDYFMEHFVPAFYLTLDELEGL